MTFHTLYPVKLLLSISLPVLLLLNSCSPKGGEETVPAELAEADAFVQDTTPHVTGIGGIFFISQDPAKAMDWYRANLGMKLDPYGAVFEFRNALNSEELNYLRWSAFGEESSYFNPSSHRFMINYRVQNLEGMLEIMRKNGVQILDSVQAYDYGKFVHVLDADGQKLELWEPVDSVLTKLGGAVNH